MPTIVHLLLALVLTVFLVAQAKSLAFVLRSRRAVRLSGAYDRAIGLAPVTASRATGSATKVGGGGGQP